MKKQNTKMIKLETIPECAPHIDKDVYVVYRTGGYHFFSRVPHALEIYKQPIWPYIKKIKNTKGPNKGIITPGLNINKSYYPILNLESNEFRNGLKRRKTKKMPMHRLIAFAFVVNLDPQNNHIVNHINGDTTDYRPENLEWTNPKKNSIGTPKSKRKSPVEIYDTYMKMFR